MDESGRNHLVISDKTGKFVKANIAPSTVETYGLAMQQVEIWLEGRSLSDDLLATYITGLYQDGKSPATINKIVAAVKWTVKHHDAETKDFPFEFTEKILTDIRRKGKDRRRRQVDGITWDEVEQICALAEAEATVAGLRDSALIRLMSDCLLRISEVVAVDVADVDSGLTIQPPEIDTETAALPDGTLYIGAPTREVIERYCEAGGITDGALFRRMRRGDNITGSRLSVDGARDAIKRRAREAGVEGLISGHSLRVGSAVSLLQAGASVVDLQVAGRWKSPQMPAHYARVHYARAELAARRGIARFKYGK